MQRKIMIFAAVFAVTVFAGVFINASEARAFTTYFSHTEREYISKGVVFEHSRRIADMGLLDVFILRIPAADPNIVITSAQSEEPGLKETASSLLNRTGAIAGVNGDFFGAAGTHSLQQGFSVDTRGVRSVTHLGNAVERRHSSFMFADGHYFMDFVNAHVHFFNNGAENIDVGSMNKIADLAAPTVVTWDFMRDTSLIDARIDDAVKIVVRNHHIVYISQKGETVNVPPDGYVVIMSGSQADEILYRFAVGHAATLDITANVDLFNIEQAISGGGRILMGGHFVSDGQQFVTGVHPRTAIGLTADGREVILMVVDGRGYSVGVTHAELAQLMMEAGAHNAMHLDGGGSTSMHVTSVRDGALRTVNQISGGFQRRIINALGVYVTAPVGQIRSLLIEMPDTIVRNARNPVRVYGLDEYMRRVDIPFGQANLSVSGNGRFEGNNLIAYDSGLYTITATFGGYTGEKTVYSTDLFEIRPNISEIRSYVGGMFSFSFAGVGANGNVFDLPPQAVNIEAFPPALGSAMDGLFMAEELGTGWLRFSAGETSAFIPLYLTISSRPIERFSGDAPISFSAAPDNVWGAAFYTPIPDYFAPVATLMYRFHEGEHTQAVYAHFQGVTTQGATGFRLEVFGDLSGHWLRGRIVDAAGERHLIDFARVIDWEGWRDVEVWLPEGLTYPVTLESIYIASVSSDRESAGQIYFYNLRGMYDNTADFPEMVTPPSDVFRDHLEAVFYEFSDFGNDVTFMPSVNLTGGITGPANRAMDVFLFNAAAGIYMGRLTEEFHSERHWQIQQNHTHLVEYSRGFNSYGLGNMLVLELTAAGADGNEGLMFADVTQWARIREVLDTSFTRNIAIVTDISPLDFANRNERELLHNLLREYSRNGFNVFVLSVGADGTEPAVDVIDGVRYMRFPPLYCAEGVLNEDFAVLRIRMWDNDIRYSIERVFR